MGNKNSKTKRWQSIKTLRADCTIFNHNSHCNNVINSLKDSYNIEGYSLINVLDFTCVMELPEIVANRRMRRERK